MSEEVEKAYKEIDDLTRVYETLFLLNSFAEEIKLFNSRIYVYPKKRQLKTIFVKNKYDTPTRLHDDMKIILSNYRNILHELNDYPEWKNKFINDVSKQFAFSNIQQNFPEIYKLIDQQKIFK